jgi:hypothetical protein
MLQLLFQHTIPSWASGVWTYSGGTIRLYCSLHTSDPGEAAASASTGETTYDGYSRELLSTTTSVWTVSSGIADNVGTISFGQCTGGGPVTISHFAISTSSGSGATVLYIGSLTSTLTVDDGIVPTFLIGALDVRED